MAKTGKDAVIEVLNKARADELAAIIQYMSQHYALADADYGQVAGQLKLVAIDEMRHAEMLAERVYELDGIPVTEPGMKAVRGQKIAQVMKHDIGLEEKAIEDYNRFLKVCRENHDNQSAKLFEQLIEEEQAHLNYFQNVDEHISELGTSYLAKIAGGPAEAGAKAVGFVASQAGGKAVGA
jgi:bacterioferritin